MTKKDYLIKVLENLWDNRPLWKVLLVLWKNWELDDNIIDSLIWFMEEELEKTKDEVKKAKIREWIAHMKKMKEMEEEEKKENSIRLSEIEDLIDDNEDILKNI